MMFKRFSSHPMAAGVAEYLTNSGQPTRVEFKPERGCSRPFILVPAEGEKDQLIAEALDAISRIQIVPSVTICESCH